MTTDRSVLIEVTLDQDASSPALGRPRDKAMDAPGVADVEADWFADSGGWASIEAASCVCKVVGSVLTPGRNGVNCGNTRLQTRHGFKSEHCYVCGIQSSGCTYRAFGVSTGGIGREGSLVLSASRVDQGHDEDSWPQVKLGDITCASENCQFCIL